MCCFFVLFIFVPLVCHHYLRGPFDARGRFLFYTRALSFLRVRMWFCFNPAPLCFWKYLCVFFLFFFLWSSVPSSWKCFFASASSLRFLRWKKQRLILGLFLYVSCSQKACLVLLSPQTYKETTSVNQKSIWWLSSMKAINSLLCTYCSCNNTLIFNIQ